MSAFVYWSISIVVLFCKRVPTRLHVSDRKDVASLLFASKKREDSFSKQLLVYSYGAIQIICNTYLTYFRPPSLPCAYPLPGVTWHFLSSKKNLLPDTFEIFHQKTDINYYFLFRLAKCQCFYIFLDCGTLFNVKNGVTLIRPL